VRIWQNDSTFLHKPPIHLGSTDPVVGAQNRYEMNPVLVYEKAFELGRFCLWMMIKCLHSVSLLDPAENIKLNICVRTRGPKKSQRQ
jgi:hypothetical protein